MSGRPAAAPGSPSEPPGPVRAGLTPARLSPVGGDLASINRAASDRLASDGPALDLAGLELATFELATLEQWALARDLLLRLRVGRRLGIWTLQVGVARPLGAGRAQLLGELKGWAYPGASGLQLDTMRVQGEATALVGPLIWAATFAWALETTPCRRARLLAIHDDDRQHRRLVRYFAGLGFEPLRRLGAGPADLPLRLIWGGAGLLMAGDCSEGLRRCGRRLARLDQDRAAW